MSKDQERGQSRRVILGGLGSLFSTMGGSSASEAAAGMTNGLATAVFDSAGHYDESAQGWVMPLHAWVYAPQKSTVRKAAIAAMLRQKYGLVVAPDSAARFDERINLLLADNKRGQTPQIALRASGSDVFYRPMPKTGANGHTRLEIVYPGPFRHPAVDPRADLWLAPVAGLPVAKCHLLSPDGHSVISDIDDTVKDSGVLERKRLFESTFMKPFSAVPGMADLLKRLAGPEGGVHYVSSSPWHLYAPLRQWLAIDGFPVSSLHLKHIRLKDRTILDITKSPIETKPPIIADILKRWPRRKFTLVGDSGEKDPEVYAAAARAHPGQITRILIRRAPGDASPAARFDTVFAGLPRMLWQVFDDPASIST